MPIWLAALMTVMVVMAILDSNEPDTIELEQALYCEMVQIHKDTNGEYGWPPYKGECSDDH